MDFQAFSPFCHMVQNSLESCPRRVELFEQTVSQILQLYKNGLTRFNKNFEYVSSLHLQSTYKLKLPDIYEATVNMYTYIKKLSLNEI